MNECDCFPKSACFVIWVLLPSSRFYGTQPTTRQCWGTLHHSHMPCVILERLCPCSMDIGHYQMYSIHVMVLNTRSIPCPPFWIPCCQESRKNSQLLDFFFPLPYFHSMSHMLSVIHMCPLGIFGGCQSAFLILSHYVIEEFPCYILALADRSCSLLEL